MIQSRKPALANDPERVARVVDKSPLLAGLPSDVRADLTRQSKLAHHERRSVLHRAGESANHVFLVISGRVRTLRVANDGRELTLAYRTATEPVGEEALHDSVFHSEARVVETLEALRIPVRVLRRISREEAMVATRFCEIATEERLHLERRMEALLTRPVESRVADFVLDIAAKHGVTDGRGTLVATKYTHHEIASYVGSTRETVTLVLGDLKRRGLIDFDRRRIIVRDAERLRALA